MASIQKRPDGRWRARYRDETGREHARHFARKVDAERWAASQVTDVARGVHIDPRAGKVTLGTYALAWAAGQVHRESTRQTVESRLRLHVLPFLGDRPIGTIRKSEIQSWVRGRSDLLAASTTRVVFSYVSAIFRAAVEDRLIPSSPCGRVQLPKRDRRRVEPLTVEVVRALTDAISPRYRAVIVLAAGTGLRQGECFGLTLDRVDFLRQTLLVDRQMVMLTGRPTALGPPKTAASVRTVPLPQVVVDELAAHLAAYPPGSDGLLFTNAHGRPINRASFAQAWLPAARRARLPEGESFHSLRHFYASLLIRHGESVKVIQARLGHASAAESLDTYSHLWPDSEDRTRQAVDAVLAASADSVRTSETAKPQRRRSLP